jgi:hypothetical protein
VLRASTLGAVLACAALLASCGEEEPPPPDLPAGRMLDRALDRPPASGRASIQLEAQLPRLSSGPVAAQLEGPFVLGEGRVPSFDLEGEAQAAGFGIDGSLVFAGDDAYVVFFGENYRVGSDRVSALAQRARGVDPGTWFGPPRHAGAEEVEGVDAYRIEAPLDQGRAAADLDRVGLGAAETRGLVGGRIEAWVGVDDGVVRRLRLSSEPLDFDVVLSDLGEPQTIEPPPGGGFQPIDDLLERIPGL